MKWGTVMPLTGTPGGLREQVLPKCELLFSKHNPQTHVCRDALSKDTAATYRYNFNI